MVIVAMMYGIGIAMALLTGGAIGLLLTVAHYQQVAARHQQWEQEIAPDAKRYAAALAALRRYQPAAPRTYKPTAL